MTGLPARVALAASACALAFLLAEVALRAHYEVTRKGSIEDLRRMGPVPGDGRSVQLGQMLRPSLDPRQVYELKPGLRVRFKGVDVRTEEAGYREEAIDATKPTGSARLLGLGDSTMFGWGVDEADRYMDLLEARLASEYPQTNWRAIVTAVPGYNLRMELESFLRAGRQLSPDLIVYGWNPNDVCLPSFLQPPKPLDTWDSWVIALGRGTLERRFGLEPSTRLVGRGCHGEDPPPGYRGLAGRDVFREALEELVEIAHEASIPVVLVADFTPDFEGHSFMPVPPQLIYVEVPTLGSSDLVLTRRDPHPNPRGHRLLADALYDRLESIGLWRRIGSNPDETSGDTPTGAY